MSADLDAIRRVFRSPTISTDNQGIAVQNSDKAGSKVQKTAANDKPPILVRESSLAGIRIRVFPKVRRFLLPVIWLYAYSLKEVKMQSSSKMWGITSHERLLNYPCDRYMETFHDTYYRGVTIHADPEIIFRWICQMRVAPYSYDWIDNFGRRSPQKLIPGLDELETGQKILFIFKLIDFERNKHITIRLNKIAPKFFGDTVISYKIFLESHGKCRLLVKIFVRYPKGFLGMLLSRILPLGDLIMMRRQLLNFKKLSEQTQNSV